MAFVRRSRKSGFTLRGGVMRRESLWIGGSFVRSTLASANAVAIQTSLNVAALALRPFTVVRVRGHLFYRSDQSSAAENYSGCYGKCVVTEQALAIGVTAVPTPETDSASDAWFVYENFTGRFDFTTGTGYREVGRLLTIDSKAMRKVEDGFDLISVAEAATISAGIVIETFTRTLIKLH